MAARPVLLALILAGGCAQESAPGGDAGESRDGYVAAFDEKPVGAVFSEHIPDDEPITFSRHVNPIIKAYCSECHAADEQGQCHGYNCFVDEYEVTQGPGCCTTDLPFRVCRSPGATAQGILAS